jgi:hypothetical protein
MAAEGSVTRWLDRLQAGDEEAARLSQTRRASERTVERKLELIRQTWQQETPP